MGTEPAIPGHMRRITSLGQLLVAWGAGSAEDYDGLVEMAQRPDSLAWEIAGGLGAYLLTGVVVGHSAEAAIRIHKNRQAHELLTADGTAKHKTAIAYWFDLLQLQRLEARVNTNNHGNIEFCKNLGFETEGVLRKYGMTAAGVNDVWVGSIVRE